MVARYLGNVHEKFRRIGKEQSKNNQKKEGTAMQYKNTYIKNIQRVEFTINNSCTGRCKHCSEGSQPATHHLNGERAAEVLKELAKDHKIDSIMTFGGEALIYPETVCQIHQVAKECEIPTRQLITNGCFSKNRERIHQVAQMLEESGVNDLLLSVDCFHAEFLPLEWEKEFVEALRRYYKGRFRLQPSWVGSEEEDNPYNRKTKECLAYFDEFHVERNEGDTIFPEGNACIYLAEYFEKKPMNYAFKCGDALYTTPLDRVNELVIDCNGDVIPCNFPIGNIYEEDIATMLERYNPYDNIFSKALLEDGIVGLCNVVKANRIPIDPEDYYSPCAFCKAVAAYGKK
ncbi:radical SAM/SPASM domain-containing protein [Anaerosporobacter faecicola]|uniref:radical SAM/SPASM domain-containing protein n=1 Tax=Anaerosporobacter faecicola TaxID=2718714 RepID=UPI0014395CDA|nr:radical SAM/SPASM domain-containing protein [Anaerosporobacter faecicola]